MLSNMLWFFCFLSGFWQSQKQVGQLKEVVRIEGLTAKELRFLATMLGTDG